MKQIDSSASSFMYKVQHSAKTLFNTMGRMRTEGEFFLNKKSNNKVSSKVLLRFFHRFNILFRFPMHMSVQLKVMEGKLRTVDLIIEVSVV